QLAPVEGMPDLHADQVAVPFVAGVHRDAGVAQHRLDPGGGHLDGEGSAAVRIHDVVRERDQLTLDVLVYDLRVGQPGGVAGTPVDQALAAVDLAVVEHADERHADGPGQPVVHREPEAIPVAGVAQGL